MPRRPLIIIPPQTTCNRHRCHHTIWSLLVSHHCRCLFSRCLRCLMCLSRCRQRHPDLCCGKLSTNRSLPEQLGVGFQHRRSTPCSTLKVFSSSPLCHPREFASIAEGRPQGANSISPTWVHLTCSLCQEDELSGWRRLKSSAIFISG